MKKREKDLNELAEEYISSHYSDSPPDGKQCFIDGWKESRRWNRIEDLPIDSKEEEMLLVTDGVRYSICSLKNLKMKLAESYCNWTQWMKIPK